MDITGLIFYLLIGAVAGWLAGNIMKGRGFGLIGNMVVGIVGAVVGGFLFGFLGIAAHVDENEPRAGALGDNFEHLPTNLFFYADVPVPGIGV